MSSIDQGNARSPSPQLLVVDDDTAIRDSLADMFGLEGYVVRTAEHGAAAIAVLEQGLPDLIVLDIRMPHSGWLVIDWLTEHSSRVPVIVYTATGLSQGAFGDALVVPKGAPPDALLKNVERVLQRGD